MAYCKYCKLDLSSDKFSKTGAKNKRCKQCDHERHVLYYSTHKESWKAKMKVYRKIAKDSAYEAYGGYTCKCCGETEQMFLTIDHINNDGTSHRKKYNLTAGNQLYVWLRTNKYPPGFQVLCFNCNHGKHLNGGVCPHQNRKEVMGFSFEQSGPGDTIMNLHRPDGHAQMDQKLDKGMRTPWLSQFPQEAGLVSPEESSQGGSGHMDSGYTGVSGTGV